MPRCFGLPLQVSHPYDMTPEKFMDAVVPIITSLGVVPGTDERLYQINYTRNLRDNFVRV